MNCRICNNQANYFSKSHYYKRNGSIAFTSPVFNCRKCNTLIKDTDDKALSLYFKNSPWTRLEYAENGFADNVKFYEHLYYLVNGYKKSITDWLDFGCSYGNFITFLLEKNIRSSGIEISDDIQIHAKSKGLRIWQEMEEVPGQYSFDVISSIDSLYYLKDPKIVLRQMYDKLNDNGLLLIRVSTRNWLVKLNKYLLMKTTVKALNDHSIGFSKRSLVKLLKNGGFQIVKSTNLENSKVRPKKSRILYFCTLFVSFTSLGLLNFTPGLIIVARKLPRQID